jgi:tRNA 2-selenouridine synthase
VDQWHTDIAAGNWQAFVEDILQAHYDPAYDKSMERNYGKLNAAHVVSMDDNTPDFDAAARQMLLADAA